MSTMSITKLYDSLSNKLGKETAENLTNFIDNKIDQELESKTQILATKEDLAKVREDFANLTLTTREDLARFREDFAKFTLATREDFAKFTLATREDFAKFTLANKEEIAKLAQETKGEITKLAHETKGEISRLDSKISETKSDLMKWMFIYWAGQLIAIFSFILLYFKK